MKTRWSFVAAFAAAAFIVTAATPAWGATNVTPGSSTTVTSSNAAAAGAASSVLTVTFDTPLNPAQLKKFDADIASQSVVTPAAGSGVSTNAVAGPHGAYLYCNHAYAFSDGDGTYTFQHACGGTTGPWGYRISAALCDITVGSVEETGMAWTRNGVRQGTQAPHVESCAYQFHGTYNPDHDYDNLTYTDKFVFDVEVDGDPGTADLALSGSFTSAGCTSGKACGN